MHRESSIDTRARRHLLAHLEARRANALAQLSGATEASVNAQLAHMRREELELLPLAETVLEDDDWVRLAAAFTTNDGPSSGRSPRAGFARLRNRLAASAPLGVLLESTRRRSPYEPLR